MLSCHSKNTTSQILLEIMNSEKNTTAGRLNNLGRRRAWMRTLLVVVVVLCRCCRRDVVSCWVLRSSMTSLAFCLFVFKFLDMFRNNRPCLTVSQILTSSGLSFFIFHKLIQVVFPSPGWSSCFPQRSGRDDQSRSSFWSIFLGFCVAIRRAWRHLKCLAISINVQVGLISRRLIDITQHSLSH